MPYTKEDIHQEIKWSHFIWMVPRRFRWLWSETTWLNNSMEHTLCSDTDSSSASQEIPCNYGTEDSLQESTLVPILSKMNPVHTILAYIFMIHFTIILREATSHLILNNPCLTHDWTGHCFNKRLQPYYFTNLLGDINFRLSNYIRKIWLPYTLHMFSCSFH